MVIHNYVYEGKTNAPKKQSNKATTKRISH